MQGERRGFGYACSSDGLKWEKGVSVALPDGARTPFGLVPLTAAERAARRSDILAAGVLTPASFDATNTSLQWAFYTGQHFPVGPGGAGSGSHVEEGGWEGFKAAVVQLSW